MRPRKVKTPLNVFRYSHNIEAHIRPSFAGMTVFTGIGRDNMVCRFALYNVVVMAGKACAYDRGVIYVDIRPTRGAVTVFTSIGSADMIRRLARRGTVIMAGETIFCNPTMIKARISPTNAGKRKTDA